MRVILLIMIGLSLSHAELTRDPATGIVSDPTTGLEWQDNTVGSTMTWENAITSCEDLTLGGKSDWRLPNINELKLIIDRSKVDPAIKDSFEHTFPFYYWSSTTLENYNNSAWIVYFDNGSTSGYDKVYNVYVRCVRGGE